MIIPYLDKLSPEAELTKSVNTVIFEKEKLYGHNTDINGFELAIRHCKYDLENKEILILGAGGVVPSIVYALKIMKASKIYLSNRTKEKAVKLKNSFNDITIIDWGKLTDFDMIINATSLGLKENDEFGLDFSKAGKNKLFYDVIYNPHKNEFSEAGNIEGNVFENGLSMFLFQAQKAFNIWHKIEPKIDQEVIKFLGS